MWSGTIARAGYGVAGRFGHQAAHRLSYSAFQGPIPDGLHVLHKCDVRACVNPNHLWAGTHRDNMADMRTKGRAVRGVEKPHPRLTELIDTLNRLKLTGEELGRVLRVDPRTVRGWVSGERKPPHYVMLVLPILTEDHVRDAGITR